MRGIIVGEKVWEGAPKAVLARRIPVRIKSDEIVSLFLIMFSLILLLIYKIAPLQVE